MRTVDAALLRGAVRAVLVLSERVLAASSTYRRAQQLSANTVSRTALLMASVLLRVWLIEDSSDGQGFLADVCAMLGALAGRSQQALSFNEDKDSRTPSFLATCSPETASALGGEVGVHRAQLVPSGSTIGRVVTVKVGVALVGGEARESAPASVLKTYSYPEQWVVRHATGERFALSAVLSGDAGSWHSRGKR